MCVMSHNWSATKQRLHLQSVAEISRHSVLSGGQDSTMCDAKWTAATQSQYQSWHANNAVEEHGPSTYHLQFLH